jgi:hypothetical protein
MKFNQHLKEWKQVVSSRFPHLSLPQVSGLATWSFGMVMTRSSSLTQVSALIAKINHESENLALALDATCIGQNFTVLSIHVLYRGCGVPVAWKIVKATEKGSWKPYWLELLSSLKGIVPHNWKVIVSADRGLYANWLYADIVALGWHPLLRINHQGQYRCLDSRLTIPERAERQWLAMAVALVWVLTLGGEPLALSSDSSDTLESSSHSALNMARSLSCFVNGLLTIVARLLNGHP